MQATHFLILTVLALMLGTCTAKLGKAIPTGGLLEHASKLSEITMIQLAVTETAKQPIVYIQRKG